MGEFHFCGPVEFCDFHSFGEAVSHVRKLPTKIGLALVNGLWRAAGDTNADRVMHVAEAL
jgi:hypothetical protein